MSERKVLNKYYPPDFDPSKIPRARQGKNRQFTVRLMAPCNMRCNTCGEYIYKGKKFNARKEDVENQDYLGIRIYRFYIKCTRCLQEISFKTDPVSTDYIIEAGATRNFMALKLAEEQAEREEAAEKEEEATNPMKLLEKRTEASKNEMASLEALEELRELNQRKVNLDYDVMLNKYDVVRDATVNQDDEEDDRLIEELFGKNGQVIKRIQDSDSDDDGPSRKKFVSSTTQKPTDILTTGGDVKPLVPSKTGVSTISHNDKSVGMLSINKKKLVLVKPKVEPQREAKTENGSIGSISGGSGVPSILKLSHPDPSTKNEGSSLSLLGAYSSSEDSE